MREMVNSREFVTKVVGGDADSFRVLFSYLTPKLSRFIAGLFSLPHQDADEIAVDAMLKVRRAVADFDASRGAKLTTWIFEIAKNTAIDHLRKQETRGKFVEVPLDDAVLQPSNEMMNGSSDGVDEGRVETPHRPEEVKMRKALDSLSKEDQAILLSRLTLEYEDIARVENASVGTLRTRHSRALARLRAAYLKGNCS